MIGYPKPQQRVRPRRKYGNSKPQLYGITFDSGLERDLYLHLLSLKEHGAVQEVQVKDHVYLTDARICLIADFRCRMRTGEEQWFESKGFETPEWRLKRRLWISYGPGILEVWKRAGKKGLVLHETIVPKGQE